MGLGLVGASNDQQGFVLGLPLGVTQTVHTIQWEPNTSFAGPIQGLRPKVRILFLSIWKLRRMSYYGHQGPEQAHIDRRYTHWVPVTCNSNGTATPKTVTQGTLLSKTIFF